MFGSIKKYYFRTAAFMVIFTTYLPVIYKNLPPIVGSHHFYAAIWLVSLVFFYPRILGQKTVLYFLFFGLVFIGLFFNTFWSEMDDRDKGYLLSEFYVFSVAISVIFYFIMEKDYEGLAWLVKWSLIFIGITAIMSIYAASVNPMYARMMTAGDLFDQEYFEKIGAGGYGFASALVALFPIMIYYYKNNSFSIFSKKLIIAFGVICFIALVKMQIFTNILLSIIIIILSLLGRKRMNQSILILSFFLIIFFVIPKTIYAEILVSISAFFDPESNVFSKLNDMADFITVGDRYATGVSHRTDRYPMLLEAFAENPIFGYSMDDPTKFFQIGIGYHLYWMYKLTVMGLLGFISLLVIHISYIKSAIKLFNKEFAFYFLISVFAVIGLGLMKALVGRELWITYFILLPGMYFLPFLKKRKPKSSSLNNS